MKREDAIEAAARAAHEVNRAYCRALADYSQPDWQRAPEWQRASARAGAAAVLDNPDTTPEQSHEGWFAQKVADGWVYGPTKDPNAKTHPCMVPYSELPASQRAKDSLFGATVRGVFAHLASLGYEVGP